jgi:hypothetical protein
MAVTDLIKTKRQQMQQQVIMIENHMNDIMTRNDTHIITGNPQDLEEKLFNITDAKSVLKEADPYHIGKYTDKNDKERLIS